MNPHKNSNKKIKVKTSKTYSETFFTNCILKNNSVKTAFYATVKNLRGECKKKKNNNGRHKGSCWTLILFSSKVISFEHFAQTSTITKLLIKVKIWLVQSLGFKVQSSRLSTINRNPPFAYVISSIWYSPLPFWRCSFAIISSYCFTSEIQELMFLSQALTTFWHLIQFPIAYHGVPFVNGGFKLSVILPFMITEEA